ncbi:MAG: copper resistance protein CopC [Azospirillum sp.]|nr:copper resistance protein CopC [Azospirillum sp.]
MLLLALAVVIGGTAPADAHAIVLESVPALNATVAGPEVAFRLRFNSRIDHKRSKVSAIAADGSIYNGTLDPGDQPAILSGRFATLAKGKYRLRWQVLAVDGHITRGDIPFVVGAP